MPRRALASTSKYLYISRTGGTVRVLPHDFVVSWSATHKHFLRWTSDGT
jgi:hypothetical protein